MPKDDTQAKASNEHPEVSPVNWEKRYNDQQDHLRKLTEEMKEYKERTIPDMETRHKKAIADNYEWQRLFKTEHEPYRERILEMMEADKQGRPYQMQQPRKTALEDQGYDFLNEGSSTASDEIRRQLEALARKNQEFEKNLADVVNVVGLKAKGIHSAIDFVNELARLRTSKMIEKDTEFDEQKIVQEALKTGNLNVGDLYKKFYGERDEQKRIDTLANQKLNELKEAEAASKIKSELSEANKIDNTSSLSDRIKGVIAQATEAGKTAVHPWSPIERNRRWNKAISDVKGESLERDGIDVYKGR